MATVVNTLYPPVISTFAKAFKRDEDMKIYFSISKYNSETDIKKVHVSVSLQTNNENALSDTSGILVFNGLNFDSEEGMYYVTISAENLINFKSSGGKKLFLNNQYYKVQVRFDSSSATYGETNSEKMNYLLNYQTYFSEWSSVCLVKAISTPVINLKTFKQDAVPVLNKGAISVVGKMYFYVNGENDSTETETMQSYKVQILDKSRKNVLKETSIIYSGNTVSPNEINTTIDLQTLDTSESSSFVLRVIATTKNMYETSQDYEFSLNSTVAVDTFSPQISETIDNESGIVTIAVKNVKALPEGTILIKRLSSEDNFKNPELIWSGNVIGTFQHTVTDNTVASLVWYKYSVQYLNSMGAGSPVYYSRVIMPDFYDAILSRGDSSFAIRYNYTISSLKPVVNRTKVDTLGGRYPRFAENAILNYKQFSISGLITAESDAYQTFLKKNKVMTGEIANYYETYKLHPHDSILPDSSKGDDEFSSSDPDAIRDLVRNDFQQWKKFDDFAQIKDESDRSELESTTDSYLTTTQNDWLWERKFREELVAWLNNGEPKLYRSMTEGNMVVMLTDVSLTPTSKMSRFSYQFSATMYEVADASSLDNLDSLGIYTIHTANEISSDDGGDGDVTPTFVEVVKVGQTYNLSTSSIGTKNIVDVVLEKIKTNYGKTGELDNGTNIWDEKNVQSVKQPTDLTLKNVKIFFHNRPSLFYFDASGSPRRMGTISRLSTDDTNILGTRPTSMGYSFEMATTRDNQGNLSYQTIFVNENGYYQIPDDVEVIGLSFKNVSKDAIGTDGTENTLSADNTDIVTLEYTVTYKELDNEIQIPSTITEFKTVVGQQEGTFQPNIYYGDSIRNKYLYSYGDATQKMEYWKGISLDVTPFAMCKIQYKDSSYVNEYTVGQTGVLHLLKNFEVQDLCFTGRRMNIVSSSRQKYLKEWECFYDPSKKIYNSKESISNPIVNCIYTLQDNHYIIYYIDGGWYSFNKLEIDTTNITENTATATVGIASVPINGQINYYGTITQTSYD